jgi:hypothetical protein
MSLLIDGGICISALSPLLVRFPTAPLCEEHDQRCRQDHGKGKRWGWAVWHVIVVGPVDSRMRWDPMSCNPSLIDDGVEGYVPRGANHVGATPCLHSMPLRLTWRPGCLHTLL